MIFLAIIDSNENRLNFEELYFQYEKKMYYTAFQILQNKEDAEDALQNAFWAIARNIEKIDRVDSIETQIYVIKAVKSRALNLLASRKNVFSHLLHTDDMETVADADSQESLYEIENQDILIRCIKQLPPLYRDILALYYINEMNTKEIAHALGRSLAAARKQLFRGRKALQSAFREIEHLSKGGDR